MKKTNYCFMVSSSFINAIWRRVYEKDGRFYVKWNGAVIDVTDKKNEFVED